jgi:hypothetical protein
MIDNNSTVKQVSRIDYVGPHLIQTTSFITSLNYSVQIENYNKNEVNLMQIEIDNNKTTSDLSIRK